MFSGYENDLASFAPVDFQSSRLAPPRRVLADSPSLTKLRTDPQHHFINAVWPARLEPFTPGTINSPLTLRFAETLTPKTEHLKPPPRGEELFPGENSAPCATGLLEQRLFERLRLHWLAQRRDLSAPPQSAKPRPHSVRREVKALVVLQFRAVGRRLLRVSSVHSEFVSASSWTSWVKGKAKE